MFETNCFCLAVFLLTLTHHPPWPWFSLLSIHRIHKYASCSKECFILALIYIDRLIQRNNFLLTELNVHRVVITAVLLAAKFFDDAYYNNAYYAKVGGVLVSEMNTLEVEFLFRIDFSLRVLPEVYDKYHAELISHSDSMGLDRIVKTTDEELFVGTPMEAQFLQARARADANKAQFGQHQQRSVAAPMYTNPSSVVAVEAHAATTSHYPIQAIHQSVTAAIAPQAQVAGTATQPQYPFPNLAHQVSAQQQDQVPLAQHPSELNLVRYHNNAAVTATQGDPLAQYANQALHIGVTNNAPHQGQVYAGQQQQQQQDPVYYSAPAAPQGAPPAQAPALYSQTTNYYDQVGASAIQTNTAPYHPSTTTQSCYPEITPSPPPQPPINNIHGAPIAYNPGDLGLGVSASAGHMNLTSSDVSYLTSSISAATAAPAPNAYVQQQQQHYLNPTDALGLHYQQQQGQHQQHQQLPLQSHPIAIPQSCTTQYIPQDINSNSWTNRFSFGNSMTANTTPT